MELEGRPRPALMLKEWLELEFVAELSRGGFGCYPRHLVAELRGTRRSGDVIARVSAAVRDALFRPAGRVGEVALSGNNSPKRLRMGFWKKPRGDEAVDRRVPSCSASSTTASCGRRDGPSPAKPPRRRGWGRAASGGAVAGAAGRRSHDTEQEATRHSDQERERKQSLSPVSVMDFLSQDEDDDDGDENRNGNGDDDDTASPTFQRSIANIRRASDQLLQKIRQFEQLAELDISDVDDATTVTEDISCHMVETDSVEDSEGAPVQGLLDLLEQSSSTSTHCFQKLLTDFFRDEKVQKGEIRGKSVLETARAWLDEQDYSLRPIWTVVKTEIEPLERWRCLSEHEQKLLAVDLEGDILSSLVEELIVELHHH
uniref:Uncharacterized protein n=1 Tax=Avena sativa TaxID=4498 RepID=A0ACD5UD65_AVESA